MSINEIICNREVISFVVFIINYCLLVATFYNKMCRYRFIIICIDICSCKHLHFAHAPAPVFPAIVSPVIPPNCHHFAFLDKKLFLGG